jgi:hypothetical protein
MSELIEKIKKQSETPQVQMGFRRALPASKPPSILLIARVKIDETGSALKNIEGADAVLLDSPDLELTAKNLAKIVKTLGNVPWGLFLEESKDKAESLENAGMDFAVVSPESPVGSAPKNEKTGKIIQLESSMDDGLLRSLNDLPVDAVLATDSFEGNGLSYHQLMILRYMAMLVAKPLLVPVPSAITKDELKALWDAGIEAVVVTVDVTKDENLKDLHEIAAALPKRTPPKGRKVDVFLPRAGEAKAAPPPEEEEEEEEPE